MLPGGVLPGAKAFRSLSNRAKSSGAAAHVNGVLAPCVLLTRVMFKTKRVPEPDNGVESMEKAETRRVRTGPGPGRTLPETFQLVPVSPAAETGGFWKVTTVSSKVKSPWKANKLSEALKAVVETG